MTLAPLPRSRALAVAAIVLVVEAMSAIGFGVAEATQIRPSRFVVGAGTALLMLGYGAFLAAVARGVWLGRRWSRGPAVATSLLQLPIGWSFNGGATQWLAWTLIVSALTVLVCVVLPASTAIFVDEPDEATSPDVSGR